MGVNLGLRKRRKALKDYNSWKSKMPEGLGQAFCEFSEGAMEMRERKGSIGNFVKWACLKCSAVRRLNEATYMLCKARKPGLERRVVLKTVHTKKKWAAIKKRFDRNVGRYNKETWIKLKQKLKDDPVRRAQVSKRMLESHKATVERRRLQQAAKKAGRKKR